MQRTTVYVVDDDPDVLKATARLLAAAGMVVPHSSPRRLFLNLTTIGSPGCLVLDLAMPGLNGLDLQHALAERGEPLPIVFLTGHGDIRSCTQAMKNGAVDFLTKPVDDTDLLAAVAQALARAAALQEERAVRSRIENALAMLTARERQVLRTSSQAG